MIVNDILKNSCFTLKTKNYELEDEVKIEYWYSNTPNLILKSVIKEVIKNHDYDNFKKLKKQAESFNVFLPNYALVHDINKNKTIGLFFIDSRNGFNYITKEK